MYNTNIKCRIHLIFNEKNRVNNSRVLIIIFENIQKRINHISISDILEYLQIFGLNFANNLISAATAAAAADCFS